MNPDEVPDEYVHELDDELAEEIVSEDEFAEEIEERQKTIELLQASILMGRLFEEGYITLQEYVELTEPMEEYQSEHGIRL